MKNLFPLLNALLYAMLFGLITNFIYRENDKFFQWCILGGITGFAAGFIIKIALKKYFSPTAQNKTLVASILLLEFCLGLLIIGPSIWLLMRFTPPSNIHSICCETPLDYGAVQYDTVRLNTIDGATISGWYVAPANGHNEAVILIHGYGYDRRGTDFQTRILIAAGYGVLLYDLRDHGESTGKLNAFSRMKLYQSDLLNIIEYLKTKPEVNPKHIGVVGISLGSFATLNLPANTINQFSGLWLDGLRFENFNAQMPPTTIKDYLKIMFDKQTRNLAKLYYREDIVGPPPLFTQIIPEIQYPKLMIVASGLDKSERETNEKFIPFMGGNKQIWFISNAWHIGGRFEVPDEYSRKMLLFFSDAFSN